MGRPWNLGYRSLKAIENGIPFESLDTVFHSHSIATTAESLVVSTQYTNVTDRHARRHRPRLCIASRGKSRRKKNVLKYFAKRFTQPAAIRSTDHTTLACQYHSCSLCSTRYLKFSISTCENFAEFFPVKITIGTGMRMRTTCVGMRLGWRQHRWGWGHTHTGIRWGWACKFDTALLFATTVHTLNKCHTWWYYAILLFTAVWPGVPFKLVKKHTSFRPSASYTIDTPGEGRQDSLDSSEAHLPESPCVPEVKWCTSRRRPWPHSSSATTMYYDIS